jgi:hypothetical protein
LLKEVKIWKNKFIMIVFKQKNKTDKHICNKDEFKEVFVKPEKRINKIIICG